MKGKAIKLTLVALLTAFLPSCSTQEQGWANNSCVKRTKSNDKDLTLKRKGGPTYGFFVRKNQNSGWGQDLPPF